MPLRVARADMDDEKNYYRCENEGCDDGFTKDPMSLLVHAERCKYATNNDVRKAQVAALLELLPSKR